MMEALPLKRKRIRVLGAWSVGVHQSVPDAWQPSRPVYLIRLASTHIRCTFARAGSLATGREVQLKIPLRGVDAVGDSMLARQIIPGEISPSAGLHGCV